MAQNSFKIKPTTILIILSPFLVLLSFYVLKFLNVETICLWKLIFHKPCIGCGMGHAIVSLLSFDFKNAVEYNPFVIIVFPLLIYVWIKSVLKELNNINN